MTEEFLHYIWRFRLFDLPQDETEMKIEVIYPGHCNRDAGPDFFDARIRIGDTLWAGNVEIHIKSSDWFRHGHQHDPAYDSIILHVVYENDVIIKRTGGEPLPTLELTGKFDGAVFDRYERIVGNLNWVPCQDMIHEVRQIVVRDCYQKALLERLETKTDDIRKRIAATGNDWEQVFFEFVAAGMGYKVNSDAFGLLARNAPLALLQRHRDSRMQLEALLYGQAGLLSTVHKEEYPRELLKEYRFLAGKYKLRPIAPIAWKFMRMRPSAFPTIRVSQLADLIESNASLFSRAISIRDISAFYALFRLEASGYWTRYYRFGVPSPVRKKRLGKDAVDILLINTVLPFLALYGKERNMPQLIERSLAFYEQLPPENNRVIRQWRALGIAAESSFESQALLQIKKHYCDAKKCLYCGIGNDIIGAGGGR